jgi:hypothetical protein
MSYYNASITFEQFNKSYKQDCDNKIMAVWPFPTVPIAEETSHGSRVIIARSEPDGTRWHTVGEVKEKDVNGVGSQ